MTKKTPLIVLIAGLLTALAIIFSGCSTKKPWTTSPVAPLAVTFISAPTDSVPADMHTSFSWAITGGSGGVLSQYRIDDNAWSQLADLTTATITGLTPGSYTFSVQVQDDENHIATASKPLIIKEAAGVAPDTIPPVVAITQSPEPDAYLATGSIAAFAWTGFDSLGSGDDLLFQYSFGGVTSQWLPIRTVSFSNVGPMNPAVFTVWSKDVAGNVSAPATVSFVVRNATVLYIDDYTWLNSFGNVDRAKEREQKAFYRAALEGYAFAEWDNDAQGRVPAMADLTGITTIVWAADANVCAAEPNYRLYYDVGAVGGGVLKQFIDGGGHVLIMGNQALNYIYNTIPPAPSDFESAYLGVPDTLVIASIDTTVTPYDTTYEATWTTSSDFTWAVKDPAATISLPDSMKIDVAKNGNQLACDASLLFSRYGVQPLFMTGLDVGGGEPDNYGQVDGWMFAPAGQTISATLNFDAFSMPLPGMRQTIHSILNQFGEGPGL